MEKKDRLRIDVYSANERSVEELAWCAFCQDVKPLFWKDGKLFCYVDEILSEEVAVSCDRKLRSGYVCLQEKHSSRGVS